MNGESLVNQILSILSVELCCAPLAGLVLAIIAWKLNRNSQSWTRSVSKLGLALNLLTHGAAAVLMLLAYLHLVA